MKVPMEMALSVARENLKEIRTVTEWAQKMGYKCPKYFSRKFKKYYGVPPKPKLVELRIEKFHELIREFPEISCFELGLELGIGDETDLSKYIKRHTRKYPNEWKNL
ncbi:helix-turn-helix domain-containing protein [Gracilimonas tropica]|uniref:helix-turn-helix domain-containing protein n=1 Tax=Gracilimonas tropica TaxID=454600 RepID=UPI00058B1392|nr:helix-turn-helix domain-containing protein [Gracilimonas tropica]